MLTSPKKKNTELLLSPVSTVSLLIHLLYNLQTIKYQNSLTSLLDENAVSFAQAEKLYYETSLISVGNELQSTQNEQGIVLICIHDLMFDNNCTQKATMPGKHYTAMKILNIQELVEFFYQLSNISIHGSLPLLLLRSH